jgi:glycosyltransferase involved in cell wall biosynthesis
LDLGCGTSGAEEILHERSARIVDADTQPIRGYPMPPAETDDPSEAITYEEMFFPVDAKTADDHRLTCATIIIPAYNEEARIGQCLKKLCEVKRTDWEIIVSADGCSDRTIEIAKEYPVKIACFPERLGKGGGILHALEFARGESIVFLDADLSVPPKEIPCLLDKLDSYDIVIGSRNLKGSRIPVQPPAYRKVLGKGFNWLFRILFRIDLRDTQCGFKAVKKQVLEDLVDDLHTDGFAFDVDLIAKAHRRGYKIAEIPTEWSYKDGSKMDVFRQIYLMGKDLMTIWLETNKKEKVADSLEHFYSGLAGDTYERASKSWFLPRRFWHDHKNKEVVKYVAGKNVLDVGCGSGTIIKKLLAINKNAVGVDINEQFIEFCRTKYPSGKFYRLDANNLKVFENNSFDSVVCSEVLEHLDAPENALKEFYRVLRCGGSLIVTTPNASFRWALIEAIWTNVRGNILETRHKAFSKKRLNYFLRKAGYNVLSVKPFMFGCLLIGIAKKKVMLADNGSLIMGRRKWKQNVFEEN